MKILRKIYAWLNAEDVRSEMGGDILCYLFRWGVAISILLMALIYLIIKLI